MLSLVKNFVQWVLIFLSDLALRIGGQSDPKLSAECSSTERSNDRKLGFLQIGFFLANSVGYTLVVSTLTGSFSPWIGVGCVGAALLQSTADHYLLVVGTRFSQGTKGLALGGCNIDALTQPTSRPNYAKRLRIALSIMTSTLMAMGIGICLNKSAADSRIWQEYLRNNSTIVARANQAFVDTQARMQRDYEAKDAAIKRLEANRSDGIRAAGRNARFEKKDSIVAAQDAAAAFDRRLATATADLGQIGAALSNFAASRPQYIERQIEASPERIPRNVALTRLISAVYVEEVRDDPFMIVPIGLIDIAILLFDLSLFFLKAAVNGPSHYAVASVRQLLERLVAEARATAANLNGPRNDDPPPPAAPSQQRAAPQSPHPEPPINPPRRGRGRPRRNGLDTTANALSNSSPAAMNSKPI